MESKAISPKQPQENAEVKPGGITKETWISGRRWRGMVLVAERTVMRHGSKRTEIRPRKLG